MKAKQTHIVLHSNPGATNRAKIDAISDQDAASRVKGPSQIRKCSMANQNGNRKFCQTERAFIA